MDGFNIGDRLSLLDSLSTRNALTVGANSVELTRVLVCNVEDLLPGQMKEVQVGPDKKKDTVLIANVNGSIHCVGSKCTHFGAPMAQGMLLGERVFCPWHLASFSVITGYPDFGPVFKALPVYKVEIEDGKIYVNVPKKAPSVPIDVGMVDFSKIGKCENKRFVIVGAGPAGLAAAETLRQSGFTGKITMVNKEGHLPYDRTIVSKFLYGAKAEKLQVRDNSFFENNQIDVVSDEVVGIDVNGHEVSLKSSGTLKYDKVLITTGLRPRPHPSLPYKPDGNVFYVRGANDAASIQNFIASGDEPKNVVVVGGGFISLESAATTKQKFKNANVSVVSRSEVHSKSLGDEVGRIWKSLSEKNGVSFHTNSSIKQVKHDSQGRVNSIVLKNGDELPADLVIVGVGSLPNTDFLRDAPLSFTSGGKVIPNSFLRAGKDLFVAGDITQVFSNLKDDFLNNEHYSEAISQGSNAAWNMLGKMIPYKTVPFFWTRAFNKSLAGVGQVSGDLNVIVKGKPDEFNFIAYYVDEGGIVRGAAGMGHNKELIAINQAMRLKMSLLAQDMIDPGFSWEVLYSRIRDLKEPCKCERKCNNEL